MTGESPAVPGRAQRELLDGVCLARHGASVVHGCEKISLVARARTKWTYHDSVKELHAIRRFAVTDSLRN